MLYLAEVKVKWFQADKGYGVAVYPGSGQELGINIMNGRRFYCGRNAPTLEAQGQRITTSPNIGDSLFISGVSYSRKGQRHAELWSPTSEYDNAVEYIKRRTETLEAFEASAPEWRRRIREDAEKIRLKCNPTFRCMEQEHYLGVPTIKPMRRLFEGTREDFVQTLKPGSHNNYRPMVMESGRLVGGFRYMRWFERYTGTQWVKCDDPRNISLPPTPGKPTWSFEEAWILLRKQEVRRAATTIGFAFQWSGEAGQVVAYGNSARVVVSADDYHRETELTGHEAEFLWEESDTQYSHLRERRTESFRRCGW